MNDIGIDNLLTELSSSLKRLRKLLPKINLRLRRLSIAEIESLHGVIFESKALVAAIDKLEEVASYYRKGE
jgi:hypothetical protein